MCALACVTARVRASACVCARARMCLDALTDSSLALFLRVLCNGHGISLMDEHRRTITYFFESVVLESKSTLQIVELPAICVECGMTHWLNVYARYVSKQPSV